MVHRGLHVGAAATVHTRTGQRDKGATEIERHWREVPVQPGGQGRAASEGGSECDCYTSESRSIAGWRGGEPPAHPADGHSYTPPLAARCTNRSRRGGSGATRTSQCSQRQRATHHVRIARSSRRRQHEGRQALPRAALVVLQSSVFTRARTDRARLRDGRCAGPRASPWPRRARDGVSDSSAIARAARRQAPALENPKPRSRGANRRRWLIRAIGASRAPLARVAS